MRRIVPQPPVSNVTGMGLRPQAWRRVELGLAYGTVVSTQSFGQACFGANPFDARAKAFETTVLLEADIASAPHSGRSIRPSDGRAREWRGMVITLWIAPRTGSVHLADDGPRESDRGEHIGGVALHEHDVAGFDRAIGAPADGDAKVRLLEKPARGAGPSLTPSPTIATNLLRASDWIRLTPAALSSGSTSARTRSMPTCFATTSAVRFLSPVVMTGSIPNSLSWRTSQSQQLVVALSFADDVGNSWLPFSQGAGLCRRGSPRSSRPVPTRRSV
jgi:hypothetical protein